MSADPKIIDLLKNKKEGETPVSLEYFPPRTEVGVEVRYVYAYVHVYVCMCMCCDHCIDMLSLFHAFLSLHE